MFNQEPAPVPAADLDATLAEFGHSRMLPRAAYVDPAVFAWEQRHIFSSWMCVGYSADLPERGSQRAVAVGNGGVLLTRDDDGEVHAFANTCRHRGHELLACGADRQTAQHRVPVPLLVVQARRLVAQRAELPRCRVIRPVPVRPGAAARRRLARLVVRRPERHVRRVRRTRRGLRGRRRPVPPGGAHDRRPALVRAGLQLEGDRRELSGVLPLLDDPSRTLADQPADER